MHKKTFKQSEYKTVFDIVLSFSDSIRMRCTIPEISWHNRDPVLSVDIQPKTGADTEDNLTRLASGGTDSHVLIWYIKPQDEQVQLELAADLARHSRAVNVVRWSPSGEILASGDDEAFIILWQKKNTGVSTGGGLFEDTDNENIETWLIYRTLRGHLQDVYDLAWSPNSQELLSGSVDNTAIVWDVKKSNRGTNSARVILNDHKGFVQGVAWDPKNKYLATLSTDRYFRLFHARTHKLCRRLSKARYPMDKQSPHYEKTFRLFHDDTLQTFYRRMCFSPDGELIIVPSGVMEDLSGDSENAKPRNTTYIFTRHNTKAPAVILPAVDQYTVAVRCCPLLFTLRPHDEHIQPMINLPYRCIFAIATKKSVYFYDTQQRMPFGVISNIHYARLTDLTWSSDGSTLIVSSVDGFCTLVTFEQGELGDIYSPPSTMDMDIDDEESSKDSDSKEETEENVKPQLGQLFKTTQLNGAEASGTKKSGFKDTLPKVIAIKRVPSGDKHAPVIEIQIPETIIATTDQFESPEYKSKPATPIAVRRMPRTAGNTPSSSSVEAKTPSGRASTSYRKSPRVAVKSAPPEQEEALDSWPKPIDDTAVDCKMDYQHSKDINEQSEDIRLIYEGDSELTNIKATDDKPSTVAETKCTVPIELETVTPDSKSAKTPRRVELRTLSTPKAKKKIL